MSKPVAEKAETSKPAPESTPECFVIMPIADSDGYDQGHFTKVYEDILKPACEVSGHKPIRADEVKQTNLIHLDILQKLIESPMAICDLSSRNPNVLFELGLRQAFDKPTVLVQEVGTPKIFDIAPLRYTEYRKELRYREVLEDQQCIARAINATREATSKGEGVNSIVRILSLSRPATLKEVSQGESSGILQLIRAEMSELRYDFRMAMRKVENSAATPAAEYYNPVNISITNRSLREIRAILQDVELYISQNAPLSLVHENINTVQKRLRRILEGNISEKISDEVRSLLKTCENLEMVAISQLK